MLRRQRTSQQQKRSQMTAARRAKRPPTLPAVELDLLGKSAEEAATLAHVAQIQKHFPCYRPGIKPAPGSLVVEEPGEIVAIQTSFSNVNLAKLVLPTEDEISEAMDAMIVNALKPSLSVINLDPVSNEEALKRSVEGQEKERKEKMKLLADQELAAVNKEWKQAYGSPETSQASPVSEVPALDLGLSASPINSKSTDKQIYVANLRKVPESASPVQKENVEPAKQENVYPKFNSELSPGFFKHFTYLSPGVLAVKLKSSYSPKVFQAPKPPLSKNKHLQRRFAFQPTSPEIIKRKSPINS